MASNTRIRYDKNGSRLTSRRVFVTSSDESVRVNLDTDNMTFKIVSATDGRELKTGGGGKNLAVLKRQAKQALAELGVEFASESRDRKDKGRPRLRAVAADPHNPQVLGDDI